MNAEFFRWCRLRWRGLFRRKSHEAALDREMQFHLDMLVTENVEAGMSPEEARFAALREFGGVTQYREECRDSWRSGLVTGVLGDFAFAARSLRRSPGFTAVAAFTLALGIGVNAVVFSMVRDSILLPLLRDQQFNFVALYNGRVGADQNFRLFSHAEFGAARESPEVFADVAAFGMQVSTIGPERNVQRRLVAVVSENYFSLLDVKPVQGRFFTAEESRPGASIPVLVANYALWERLGRPENFVGSTLRVQDRAYTVIGIAPKRFVGFHVSIGPDAWLPLGEAAHLAGWDLTNVETTPFNLYARLRPGLSLESATARLTAVERRINALPPADQNGARRLVLTAPSRVNFGDAAPNSDVEAYMPLFAALALGLSLTVLVVACLNLGNMLLARGVARQKEIAIRLSLGASRWRVVRGLLAEGLLLALLGGIMSLALGWWGQDLLFVWSKDAFASSLFTLSVKQFLDPSVVVVTLICCVVATIAFSLWPALRVTRPELFRELKQLGGQPAVATRWRRFFSVTQLPLLVQIALSLTLLFSAALFVRSSRNAQSIDLGFELERQLVALVDYEFANLDRERVAHRQQVLLASLANLPGVTDAALASNVPYSFSLSWQSVREFKGAGVTEAAAAEPQHWAGYTAVTRGYFATMGIELRRGRDFTPEESAGSGGMPVAVIDESLARTLFGEADAIGRRVVVGSGTAGGTPVEIIGIVRSSRDDVFTKAPWRIYRALGQAPESSVYVQLRTSDPAAAIEGMRRHLQATAPEATVLFVRPMAQIVAKNINVLLVRLTGAIFGIFGLIALVIAVVGVYGVKAHAVARRTREIGIRVALGARPQDVMNLILKQGAAQAAVGVGLGVVLALLVGRGLAAMLYHVSPEDPLALGISAMVLASAVMLACWLPARRATRVDPLVAIRNE